MINHVRSVLLNAICPGEFAEPADESFCPLPITAPVAAARRHLIPDKFPLRTINFMATMWQELASQHQAYPLIQAIDARELLTNARTPALLTGGLAVTNCKADGAMFDGIMSPTPQTGIFAGEWVVRRSDTSEISVCDVSTMDTVTFDMTFNSDCSNRIVFAGGIGMRIMGAESLPNIDVLVSSFAPFAFDLTTILSKMRTTNGITGIFSLRDNPTAGRALLSDFLNSRRTDTALAAAVIACVLKLTEGAA